MAPAPPTKTGKRLMNNLSQLAGKLFGEKKPDEATEEEEDEGFNLNILKRLKKYKMISSVKVSQTNGKLIVGIDPQVQGRIKEVAPENSN